MRSLAREDCKWRRAARADTGAGRAFRALVVRLQEQHVGRQHAARDFALGVFVIRPVLISFRADCHQRSVAREAKRRPHDLFIKQVYLTGAKPVQTDAAFKCDGNGDPALAWARCQRPNRTLETVFRRRARDPRSNGTI